MTTEELLIHELAQRAGVSVRTIRYYIEEGLLPQPTYQGKYSIYTPEYLDRLELIRRLKESYLPLREIREIMSSLTDEQVRIRLKEAPPSTPKFSMQVDASSPNLKPGARALHYINRLIEDQTQYKTKGSIEESQPIRKDRDEFSQLHIPIQFQKAIQKEETWVRISIAPRVELHLRQPLDEDTENRGHQIFIYAKKILQDKS